MAPRERAAVILRSRAAHQHSRFQRVVAVVVTKVKTEKQAAPAAVAAGPFLVQEEPAQRDRVMPEEQVAAARDTQAVEAARAPLA